MEKVNWKICFLDWIWDLDWSKGFTPILRWFILFFYEKAFFNFIQLYSYELNNAYFCQTVFEKNKKPTMNNNDILRRVRYIFDFSDKKMIELFASGGLEVTQEQVIEWLRKDDDPLQKSLYDKILATFLNGFINDKRGKREGEQPKPEKSLNNNMIFRKLKIALNLKDVDIIEIFKLVKMNISKHEISALFRKPTQSQYRLCHDQFLRNFLYGLSVKYRGGKV